MRLNLSIKSTLRFNRKYRLVPRGVLAMLRTQSAGRTGFTLIELLVVIATLAVLVGLLLPAVQKAREAANPIRCANNLKQIGLALHNYVDANSALPPNGLYPAGGPNNTWSALARLLPFVEQGNLHRQIDFSLSY